MKLKKILFELIVILSVLKVFALSWAQRTDKSTEQILLEQQGLGVDYSEGVFIPAFLNDIALRQDGRRLDVYADIWKQYAKVGEHVDDPAVWAYTGLLCSIAAGNNTDRVCDWQFCFTKDVVCLHGETYSVSKKWKAGAKNEWRCTLKDELTQKKIDLRAVVDGAYVDLYENNSKRPTETLEYVNKDFVRYVCVVLTDRYRLPDDAEKKDGWFGSNNLQAFASDRATTDWIELWKQEKTGKRQITLYIPLRSNGACDYDGIVCDLSADDGSKFEYVENGIRYSIENGTATVVEYFGNESGKAVVKNQIVVGDKNFPVTAIKAGAFSTQHTVLSKPVEEIELPTELTTIEAATFLDCKTLKKITAKSRISKIGESAFEGCTALETVSLKCDGAELGRYIFYNCPKLTNSPVSQSGDEANPGIRYRTTAQIEMAAATEQYRLNENQRIELYGVDSGIYPTERYKYGTDNVYSLSNCIKINSHCSQGGGTVSDFSSLVPVDETVLLPNTIVSQQEGRYNDVLWLDARIYSAMTNRDSNKIAQFFPYFANETYVKNLFPKEQSVKWTDHFSVSEFSFVFTQSVICIGRKAYLVNAVSKEQYGYRISVAYCPDKRQKNENNFLYSELNGITEKSFDLFIDIDGDYMQVYIGSRENYLCTLVRVSTTNMKCLDDLVRNDVQPGSDSITWPKRSDGTCDFDSSSNKKMRWKLLPNEYEGRTMAAITNLRLRSSPSMKSDIITTITKDTPVLIIDIGKIETIDGIQSNWMKVILFNNDRDAAGKKIPQNTAGWCFAGYLR